jgi:hypothetical protein
VSNLEVLSPIDFEHLVQDLLTAEYGERFESFSAGRDGGIDLRLISKAELDSSLLIVQCKHYAKSGFSKLLTNLEAERAKAVKLKSDRYIVATSVRLSPARKAQIRNALGNIVRTDSDVLGEEDIFQLLRLHPEVEKKHFKLWLHSTAILEKILHNEIINRTQADLDEMISKSKMFVSGQGVEEARKRLEDNHVCIVTGAPGVGKTTLCNVLLLDYSSMGFTPIVIGKNVAEAFELFDASQKQIFLYDDFLGRTTSLDKLEKNEDSDLIRFIRLVGEKPNALFLLTTRDYLYHQARHRYENMKSSPVETSRMVLSLDNYSRENRARILYNHIYYSDMSDQQKTFFVKSRKYVDMINSRNYNPRSIETATRLVVKQAVAPEEVPELMLRMVEDPRVLWEHILTAQINFGQKICLALIVLNGGSINVGSLESVFLTGMDAIQKDFDFDDCLEVLEGTTITITPSKDGDSVVSLYNPGIEDVVIEFVLGNALVLSKLPQFLRSVRQFLLLWNHANTVQNQSDHYIVRWFFSNRRSSLIQNDKAKFPDIHRRLKKNVSSFLNAVMPYVSTGSARSSYGGMSPAEQISVMLRISEECSRPIDAHTIDGVLKRILRQYHRLGNRWDADSSSSVFSNKKDAWELIDSVNLFVSSFGSRESLAFLRRASLDYILAGEIRSVDDWEVLWWIAQSFDDEDSWLEDHSEFAFSGNDLNELIREEMPAFIDRYRASHDLTEADRDVEELEGLLIELELEPEEYLSALWDDVESAKNEYTPDDEEYESDSGLRANADSPERDEDRLFDSLLD